MLPISKKSIGRAHEHLVFNRRARVLAAKIGEMLPTDASVLDIGTGDGQIAKMIGERQKLNQVQGLDVMRREMTHIPVTLFDGITIPLKENSVDVITFIDVLHHTNDPQILIHEASRVARKAVVIKDHLSENVIDSATLRFMDWIGNAPHGVLLPYNYASQKKWDFWFDNANLSKQILDTSIPLYPPPLNWIFGRNLHFIAYLTPIKA
jgi:SAM-dependent methyltransferase